METPDVTIVPAPWENLATTLTHTRTEVTASISVESSTKRLSCAADSILQKCYAMSAAK
jgi:hypothetical protein